jgi:hypothetical protein
LTQLAAVYYSFLLQTRFYGVSLTDFFQSIAKFAFKKQQSSQAISQISDIRGIPWNIRSCNTAKDSDFNPQVGGINAYTDAEHCPNGADLFFM